MASFAERAPRPTLVLLLALVLGLACPAWPAPADPAEDGAFGTLDEQADEHVRQARQHFNAGQYDQAIERLTLAYGLRPRPEYLFSIAQSYRRAGKNREALRAYQRFLRVAPDSNLRSEAGNYIGELTLLLRQQEAAERERRRPVWRRPWFWGVLGSATVAAGVALGVGLGVGLQQPPPETLTFSWRRPLAYPESR